MVELRILLWLFFLLFFLQLSLVVGFVVYLLKARKPLLRCDASLAFEQVYENAVWSLLDTLPCKASFLSQASFIAEVCFITEVIDAMQKLASLAIHAIALLLVLAA